MYEKGIKGLKKLVTRFFSAMIFIGQIFLLAPYWFDNFISIDFMGWIVFVPPLLQIIFFIIVEILFLVVLLTLFSLTFNLGQGSPLFLSDMKDGGEYKIIRLGPEIKGFKHLLLVSAKNVEDKDLLGVAWYAIRVKRIDGHLKEGIFVIKSESGCIIPVSSDN